MPDVIFSVDQSKSMTDQAVPGHNRWHPDIPAAASVKPGATYRVECKEWTNGQIGNNDSANDVRDVNLAFNHMLSGPFAIEGAQPGDLLVRGRATALDPADIRIKASGGNLLSVDPGQRRIRPLVRIRWRHDVAVPAYIEARRPARLLERVVARLEIAPERRPRAGRKPLHIRLGHAERKDVDLEPRLPAAKRSRGEPIDLALRVLGHRVAAGG